MLDGSPEGEPGLGSESEHVCPVPDLRLAGGVVTFYQGSVRDCPERDYKEVLPLVEEERVVIRERCRVRAGIPDLDLVQLFGTGHIRDIKEGQLDTARGDATPVIGGGLLADPND